MKKKNKSTPKANVHTNRQYLVNKISDAMRIKYSNFFTAANYDEKTLKEDIDQLITTQYYSKDPKDVFKPIETNILDIVKKKNPQLQVKIKKARKLPQIKYTKDKYQEADDLDKEKENNLTPVTTKKTKPKSQKYYSVKKTNKPNNKIENLGNENNQIQLTEVKNNNNNINNVSEIENKNEEINNTMYRLQQEYGVKHTLVDELNNKMKYDPNIQYLNEEQKLYEQELKEKKQKKILEQNKYLNDLKIQIEQRNKLRELEKQNKMK